MSHAGRIVTSTEQEHVQQHAHPAYQGAVDPGDKGQFSVIPPGVNLHLFDGDIHPRGEQLQVVEHVERMPARDIVPGRRDLPGIVCASRLEPSKNQKKGSAGVTRGNGQPKAISRF